MYIYGAPILDVSRSHTTTQHSRWDSSGRLISSSQRPLPVNTQHSQQTSMPHSGIRTHDLSRRAAVNLGLRPPSHWDQHLLSKFCRLRKEKTWKCNFIVVYSRDRVSSEKPLSASSCLSACISVTPTGRIFMNFYIGDFYENISRRPNLVETGQQCREIYLKT